jgi:hypothetical protein
VTPRTGKLSKKQQDRIRREQQAQFNAGIALMLPPVRSAIGAYLDVCRARLQQSAWGLTPQLVAAGPIAAPHGDDPRGFTQDQADSLQTVLDGAAPEWPGIVASKIMPAYTMMLGQLPHGVDTSAPEIASTMQGWRSEWLTERQQTLVGVPDDIAGQLRTELDRLAAERGTSVFDARNAAQDMLDKGYPSWEGRAQLIARTEVVSSNNQSALRAWSALAEAAGVSDQATKTWVGGTRPTHSAVSGTTIGIGELFTVGASEMNGPGDPAGGAGECANCRCSLAYALPSDTTSTDEESAPIADTGGEADTAGTLAADTAGDTAAEAATAERDIVELSDAELSQALTEAGIAGDMPGMDRVMSELDRRDRIETETAEKQRAAEERARVREAKKDAAYERLLAEGASPESAFADAYGVGEERQRVDAAMQQLRANGYTGKGFRDLSGQAFQEEADRMFWVAEGKTNGYMLNRDGLKAGVDPRSLFTGPESRARKYASRELLDFWQQYGRVTADDFRAGLLGGRIPSRGTAAWS